MDKVQIFQKSNDDEKMNAFIRLEKICKHGTIRDYDLELESYREEKYEQSANYGTAKFNHKTLEERAEEYGGKITVDGEFDWGEPMGEEMW